MQSVDGRYWITYNGEVYNFQPLRRVLVDLGYEFRSHTDTEVLLNAYIEWGEACLNHFRGMFALAIWDTQRGKLFAARDRLGIKPVYYSLQPHPANPAEKTLVFGSELKALLESGLVKASLNPAAVHHFLSFYAVPSPLTILEGVEALPPGHFLTFENGELHVERYWDIPAITPLDLSEDLLIDQLRSLLEESIRLRMIADVPVGAFLSGGIDSAAVVALMTRISGERLKTFSIGFEAEGAGMDERSAARVLADHYGTEHTEVIVTGEAVRREIGAIIRAMDQPSGDGLNTYLVSQATAQHVKVALSGLGGDELFAGYPQFRMFEQADRYRRAWEGLPSPLRGGMSALAGGFGPGRRAMTWLEGDLLDRYERVRVLYGEKDKRSLYTPAFSAQINGTGSSLNYLGRYVREGDAGTTAALTRLELKNYMAHTLLRDTDAMSMAHSLEVRVPLIDHRLVEFAVRLPTHLKLREGRTKWAFVAAVKDLLPPEVVERPKRGFEMPVAAWMRTSLRDVVEDALSRESVTRRGMFSYEAVHREYGRFQKGQAPYLRLWSLAVLELWMRAFIDGEPLAA
jgi:asparagine synthase (glutamine-hydrolysing)